MAAVLNRTTKQYIQSANTPDYPIADWIHSPDLTAVVGFNSKYWIITGDAVSLMTQTERDVIDAADLESSRDSLVSQLDEIEGLLRAFAGVLVDEINVLRANHSLADRTLAQLKTAIRNKVGS